MINDIHKHYANKLYKSLNAKNKVIKERSDGGIEISLIDDEYPDMKYQLVVYLDTDYFKRQITIMQTIFDIKTGQWLSSDFVQSKEYTNYKQLCNNYSEWQKDLEYKIKKTFG